MRRIALTLPTFLLLLAVSAGAQQCAFRSTSFGTTSQNRIDTLEHVSAPTPSNHELVAQSGGSCSYQAMSGTNQCQTTCSTTANAVAIRYGNQFRYRGSLIAKKDGDADRKIYDVFLVTKQDWKAAPPK